MKIKTKFGLNDCVYPIIYSSEKVKIKCGFCTNSGVITGCNNKSIKCPECHGDGYNIQVNYRWKVSDHLLRVKTINSCVSTNLKLNQTDYICFETGIGSGTSYDETRLFLTKEEAQEECNKINRRIKK